MTIIGGVSVLLVLLWSVFRYRRGRQLNLSTKIELEMHHLSNEHFDSSLASVSDVLVIEGTRPSSCRRDSLVDDESTL